ncbi:hypothetical protein DM02DRAFT_617519 [Periconia macrospinosa]|uniref:CFEM domain-containing protein n=1 Tax=Periconia macrospinosa TaxID=97972 RepID=A0A2V1DFQ1_9PLEO|nr:hypothetical protein DM02DRAFT_617519 [Periconia macrospinosa]
MRPTATATALVALLGSLTYAQLDQLPKCAQDCFGNSLGSCKQLDFKCICGNATLISSLSCCVSTTCNPQEQASVIQLASSLCQANGVTVPTQASCASGASSSTSAPSASGNGSSNSSVVSTTPARSSSSNSPSGSATRAGGSNSPAGGVPMATAGAMGLAMGMAGMLFAL